MTIPGDWRAELDVLLSKQALHELITAYSRAADRADEDAMAALFHPGADVDSGVIRGDGDYFAREFAKWVRTHAKRVFHAVTNEWFEIEGDHAVGESYVIAISTTRSDAGDIDTITAGRYLDRFARRNGVWKFTERKFVMECSISHPSQGRMNVDALDLKSQTGEA